MIVEKIISGAQTGVDRAGLDFAIEYGIEHGGYCPKGRKAEDGRIPDKYTLIETASSGYSKRTEKNLTEADGTLILYIGKITGGTLLTANLCKNKNKPFFIRDLDNLNKNDVKIKFNQWLKENNIKVLNIAGSRESKSPIYKKAKEFLKLLFGV